MEGCYVPRMPANGWPQPVAEPNKTDPDYWLRQAEGASRIGSKMGYYFLGKALNAIMPALHMLCGGLSSVMTMLDLLSEAIAKGIAASVQIGEYMVRFVRAAMRFTVGGGQSGAHCCRSDGVVLALCFGFDVVTGHNRRAVCGCPSGLI